MPTQPDKSGDTPAKECLLGNVSWKSFYRNGGRVESTIGARKMSTMAYRSPHRSSPGAKVAGAEACADQSGLPIISAGF